MPAEREAALRLECAPSLATQRRLRGGRPFVVWRGGLAGARAGGEVGREYEREESYDDSCDCYQLLHCQRR